MTTTTTDIRDRKLKLLETAKSQIENFGWAQGQYVDEDGCYCLFGAFDSADIITNPEGKGSDERGAAYDDAWELLELLVKQAGGGPRIPTAIGWNDQPGRTVDEVLALLDKAIETVKEEQA